MTITRNLYVPLAVVLLQAGCAEMDNEGELVQAANVAWTNTVRVAATANDLVKTAPQSAWNAGASSTAVLTGDGYVEFSSSESDTSKMAGLSSDDAGVSYVDIDFAIHLKPNGQIAIREGGVLKLANAGTFVAGDILRVEKDDGVVTYSNNGTVIYTSLVTPAATLVVDTSFYSPNSTITDAELVQTSLTWQNAQNVLINENNLTKTVGHPWNAGASSVETITGAGFMEFTTAETDRAKQAGLSNGDSNVNFTDIDFGIRLNAASQVRVYEGGVYRGTFGSYVAGDIFRVEANGTVVTYARNGVVFYTSTVAPTYPLLVDTSLLDKNATIQGVTLQ